MRQSQPALDPTRLRYRIVVLVFLTIMSGITVTNLTVTTILAYHLFTRGINCANLPYKPTRQIITIDDLLNK